MKIAKIYKQSVRNPRPFQWVNGMDEAMQLIWESPNYNESEDDWASNHPEYTDEDGYMTQDGINKMTEECGDAARNEFVRDQFYDCGDFVLKIVPDSTSLTALDRPWS